MNKFTDFYKSWWWLYNHPIFRDENGHSRLFNRCLDIYIVKVNPLSNIIDDNENLNTKTQVWLECGEYDKNTCWHDIELDCGSDTYEDVIIELANLVSKKYGEYDE